MPMSFQRTIETFICQVCGLEVQGDGYTNHCPNCLWSLHCDVNPGDRQAACRGLMEPVAISLDHSVKYIIHRCQLCGHEKRNKTHPSDDLDAILALPLVGPHEGKKKR